MKKCTKCMEVLDVSLFFKRGDGVGYRSKCKKCYQARAKIYGLQNNAILLRKAAARRRRNTGQTLLWVARNRAKKKGWEYNLDISDVSIPTHCPILGLMLCPQMGKSAHNSPSLDRIDSSKGYIKGNVQVISLRANILKNNASFQEIEMLYSWMSKNSILDLDEKGRMAK